MSLGNREGRAGNEAEPEELPDMRCLQPAMDRLHLCVSASRCVFVVRRF